MSWLNQVIGQGIAANISACGHMASQQSTTQAIQQYQAQQAYNVGAQGMSQGYSGTNWQPPKWMFNGTMMSVIDMANSIWPEDCADKTAFVLKYSE
jgi:hypothetical protein